MRKLLCTLLAMTCLACQQVTLPQENEKVTDENTGLPAEGEDENGGVVADGEEPEVQDAMWADEFLALYPTADDAKASREEVVVAGYIVGAYSSNKKCLFTSEEYINMYALKTNLVIAPYPDELQMACAIPVELRTTGKVRENLNLVDNPFLIGRQIVVRATCDSYFSCAGLKKVKAYKVLQDESSQPSQPEEPVKPGTEPEEENEDTIAVDDQPQVLPGGRCL